MENPIKMDDLGYPHLWKPPYGKPWAILGSFHGHWAIGPLGCCAPKAGPSDSGFSAPPPPSARRILVIHTVHGFAHTPIYVYIYIYTYVTIHKSRLMTMNMNIQSSKTCLVRWIPQFICK